MQVKVSRAAFHFVVERKRALRQFDLFTFSLSSAVCGHYPGRVKFKLLIAAIRKALS
jgi:hypothetical protein